jgi:hypothetical protein
LQPPPPGQTYLHLGGIINNSVRNWTFAGQIDEVSLWNVARSAGEIQGSMYAALTGAEPGLRAFYRMSNGAGLSLADDSGHGWTGTLKDGAPDRGVPGDGIPPQWVSSTAY